MSALNSSSQQIALSEQQAVDWLLRMEKGALNASEMKEFNDWRALGDNELAFTRARRLWLAVDEVSSSEIIKGNDQLTAQENRRRRFIGAAIAASILVLGVSAAFIRGIQDPSEIMRTAAATAVGERAAITLKDGSVLTLNTNSAANVFYDHKERKIELTRGQALFKVAKNQRRPFVVYAGDRRIVATGTTFDVRLDEAAVAVTMVEGHVLVGRPEVKGEKGAYSQVELGAGQRLVAKRGADSLVSITFTDPHLATSWISGELIFRDVRLADAIAEANRYTRTVIVLEDDTLGNELVNGVFRAGQPSEFARALSQIFPISVDYDADGQIRLSWKSKSP